MGKENGVMFQYFEWYLPADASLWKTVSANAQELSDKGVTSVWLPPAYKGQAGIDDTGYGVYDLYDLGEFDQKKTVPTKYGTKDEYIDAVNKLQACGIDVYADIVLNHRMGADETEAVQAVKVKEENRTETVSDPKTIGACSGISTPQVFTVSVSMQSSTLKKTSSPNGWENFGLTITRNCSPSASTGIRRLIS